MNYYLPSGVKSIWFTNAAAGVVPDDYQPSVPDGHELEDLIFCVFVTEEGFYLGVSPDADKEEAYENALQHYYKVQ